MKIVFLGFGENFCRCIIAKRILQSFDKNIEVYAAGIGPITALSEKMIQALSILGYQVDPDDIQSFDEFANMEIDYLITVSDGLREHLKKHPKNYHCKLHMEFANPCGENQTNETIRKALINYRDEIENELTYFYYHILKEKAAI